MSSSDKLYSHPDKLLVDHLKNVADNCVRKFRNIKHDLDRYFSNDIWEKLIWLMGFSHDIGKATSFFQDYLFEKDEKKKISLKNQTTTSHSLISSIIAYWILRKFIDESENELLQLMPFFIFLIIKKHHGNIRNIIPGNNAPNELDVPRDHLNNQIQSINKQKLQQIFDVVNDKLEVDLSVADIPSNISDFYKTEIRRKEKNFFKRMGKKVEYYLIFQYLYSILLQSDKYDAIFSDHNLVDRIELDSSIVESYKSKHFGEPTTKIDRIRENIFNDVNDSISKINLSQKIISLNVPTGSGKTITCLSAALKLRNRLKSQGINPRIIYGLPFTSIIDQNYQVFTEILDDPESDVLLKHHHLSEISYSVSNNEAEFESDQAKFLIESWESEIIITTFYQIFHTFFTNRNRMIQKFHKLANSIILLDEVQALPYKYWKLICEIIPIFAEMFNTYFIFITATQPEIFEPEQIVELVPQKKKYFQQFDRVNLYFNSNKITLDEYKEECYHEVKSSNESYLFVMNTIDSSLDLFNHLHKSELQAEYYYLTTNIIPKHRQERIELIKQSTKRKIVVSTQLVEAGVDIDVENVWRDFAPLESINQVCGRCNRNFSDQKGNVKIFEIVNENHNNKPFSSYIYGKSVLNLIETKKSLNATESISEKEFLRNISNYYTTIKNKMADDESNYIIKLIKELRFQELFQSFKLINNNLYDRTDIFLEYDENAKYIWQKFIKIKHIKNIFQRKSEFLKIRKDFYEYVISLPSKYVPEEEFENSGIVYISNEQIDTCYNQETGWIRTDENYIF